MGMCRNWRMWAVLGGMAVVIAITAPGARATVLPLLVVAACPLSMLAMGIGMAASSRRQRGDDAPTAAPEREPVRQ